MVLSKQELIESFRNEVHILLHLTTKIDPAHLDYRPTPKQRSMLELLRYLTMMGPELVQAAKDGAFDIAAWNVAEARAGAQTFDEVVATIAAQPAQYASMIGEISDADFRTEISVFGPPTSRGSFLVNQVLCGCAAYRTQIFLYLKACGRTELSTMNLWAGMDDPQA